MACCKEIVKGSNPTLVVSNSFVSFFLASRITLHFAVISSLHSSSVFVKNEGGSVLVTSIFFQYPEDKSNIGVTVINWFWYVSKGSDPNNTAGGTSKVKSIFGIFF